MKKPQQRNTQVPAGSGKAAWLSNKAFGVIKFILGLFMLPFVYSSSLAFLRELSLIEDKFQGIFCAGIVSFLLIYLFIWEPIIIYNTGHKVLEAIFQFFRPFLNVAPNLLPIYTIVVFILYSAFSVFIKDAWLVSYTIFLAGFSLALHLVFAAKSIRGRKDFLKANYIFGFSLIFVLNLMIVAFCFALIFKAFSFVDFSKETYFSARDIFAVAFRQLFGV